MGDSTGLLGSYRNAAHESIWGKCFLFTRLFSRKIELCNLRRLNRWRIRGSRLTVVRLAASLLRRLCKLPVQLSKGVF